MSYRTKHPTAWIKRGDKLVSMRKEDYEKLEAEWSSATDAYEANVVALKEAQARLAEREKELAEAKKVIEERGHAFQDKINKTLIERNRYREALERIANENDDCGPGGVVHIAKAALSPEGGTRGEH